MSEVTVRKPRPKHLALNQIRLPLPGIVSILHRISGVGLFLLLPEYKLLRSPMFDSRSSLQHHFGYR